MTRTIGSRRWRRVRRTEFAKRGHAEQGCTASMPASLLRYYDGSTRYGIRCVIAHTARRDSECNWITCLQVSGSCQESIWPRCSLRCTRRDATGGTRTRRLAAASHRQKLRSCPYGRGGREQGRFLVTARHEDAHAAAVGIDPERADRKPRPYRLFNLTTYISHPFRNAAMIPTASCPRWPHAASILQPRESLRRLSLGHPSPSMKYVHGPSD
ncbi:hypothetical protein OH76DRAFT_23422 [Lentinus brumalis]|uniref:Uncharacterized protein n=1 Tax=Lentinus brumalis TaxID=2498619 RepID=A0A371DXE7_9APHY|nr:hypothetical protein OH76DRAFT_23422 [Polyporus brumalis]